MYSASPYVIFPENVLELVIKVTICGLGDYAAALDLLSESLLTTECIYGATSIELANELQKYSEICANARRPDLATGAAHKALDLFVLNYGSDCNQVHELKQLVGCLSLEDS